MTDVKFHDLLKQISLSQEGRQIHEVMQTFYGMSPNAQEIVYEIVRSKIETTNRPMKLDYCTCDEGKVWNNGDPTSGQWVECDKCDHPPVSE